MFRSISRIVFPATGAVALSAALVAGTAALVAHTASRPATAAAQVQSRFTTHRFSGAKVNAGTASLTHVGNKTLLTWSDDFKIPNTPAPHWQVVDSSGNTYLLQRLVVKGDKQNRTIEVPSYVQNIAKVQIWCAYAEVLLGEASFDAPVR